MDETERQLLEIELAEASKRYEAYSTPYNWLDVARLGTLPFVGVMIVLGFFAPATANGVVVLVLVSLIVTFGLTLLLVRDARMRAAQRIAEINAALMGFKAP